MVSAVLDTCILVAAARSRLGASHALLGRSSALAEGFLDFLLSVSRLQDIFFLWRPALPDPDDDLILELAVAAGCRYIVTHNLRDFRGTEKWGVEAVTPSDFLKLTQPKP